MMIKNTDKMIIYKFINNIFFTLVFTIFLSINTFSQQQNLPIGNYFKNQIDFELNKLNKLSQTGLKPILYSSLQKSLKIDSVLYNYPKRDTFFKKHKERLLWRKLLFEDFISVEKKQFKLFINPLFYLQKSHSGDSLNYFINTRGIEIKGDVGNKLSYYSSFRENQAKYPIYISEWADNRLVIPGQGAYKTSTDKPDVYDFSMAAAYVSYSPINQLNIQIGQDKHFIGEGFRSMLISDNAFNYPFLRLSYAQKNIKYTTLWTEFRDFDNTYYDYHTKKHAAFNYLSFCIKNRIELGIFEGIIYRTTDTAEYINSFQADFFIPFPALRSFVNTFQSDHNLLIGLNTKIKLSDHLQLYGQFVLDDPNRKKSSFQTGLKIFDLFHSIFEDHQLFIQSEYNFAKPRSYAHNSIKFLSWSHYNQELSHPAGGDFTEFVNKINYSFHNLRLHYLFIYLVKNNKQSYSDIFITDQDSYIAAPLKEKILMHSVDLAYTINIRTGLQVFIAYDFRKTESELIKSEKFLSFGLRTSLANFSYDF
jgi:hypothetical protein